MAEMSKYKHFPVLQEKDQLKGDVAGILSFGTSSEMENSLFLYAWEKEKVDTLWNKEYESSRNRKVSCFYNFLMFSNKRSENNKE